MPIMWAGVECDLIPTSPGPAVRPSRDKRKDPKVWLAGELIVRCEHQGLTNLPSQLFIKATLRTLVLTGNALVSIPPEIQHLKALRELKLGYNQLQQLPDEVCRLSKLEHLNVQHNRLQDIPSALCRLVHLTIINLDGNPLNHALLSIWAPETAAVEAATANAEASNGDAEAQLQQEQQSAAATAKISGRHAAAATSCRLKERTQVLLQHLLQQQEPAAVVQVKQDKLRLLQQASTQQIVKLLCVADPDTLANCLTIATTTGLNSDLVQRIQQAQAATADMQQALHAVQALQLSSSSLNVSSPGVQGGVHENLAAALKKFEALCKPRRPAGAVYVTAHATWRTLQRQMLEQGWRHSSRKTPAGMPSTADIESAAAVENVPAEGLASSSNPSGTPTSSPVARRRYLTLPEQARQRLEAAGAKKFDEWAAEKQQREENERYRIMERAQQETRSKTQLVAERVARAVDYCVREKQWRSKVVEPFPHGTFSLSPEQLKAVRRAYLRPPDLQALGSE